MLTVFKLKTWPKHPSGLSLPEPYLRRINVHPWWIKFFHDSSARIGEFEVFMGNVRSVPH